MGCTWNLAAPADLHPALRDPWRAALDWGGDTVIAVLTATHGPAYRNPGAAMAIARDGGFAGAITSGCVEADLILRAAEVRLSGRPQTLRYGQGSPFFDLRLPCGGAIGILLFPLRDPAVLHDLAAARAARRPVSLLITPEGGLRLASFRDTGPVPEGFAIGFRPDPRFVIFGAGPEAEVFADLVRSMGYDGLLVSHDAAGLARAAEGRTHRLTGLADIAGLGIDARTAAVLFYHDHDYEPEILRHLLATPAFYIGAQGSRATQATRLERLRDLGVAEQALARVRGPIGVLPSSRDPRTLALSVMAEIVATAG